MSIVGEGEDFEGLPLAQVLEVLRVCGVGVASEEGRTILISKTGLPEAFEFPERLNRRMLHRLQLTYGIPIHYFFHPEMIPLAARVGDETGLPS